MAALAMCLSPCFLSSPTSRSSSWPFASRPILLISLLLITSIAFSRFFPGHVLVPGNAPALLKTTIARSLDIYPFTSPL